jgi:hypothetical protein
MGKLSLIWSPIQLRLETQYKIYLYRSIVASQGEYIRVKTKVDFEVIEIMDDSDPYPALLGIDKAFDNNAMLNLKKRKMSFEIGTPV